MSKTSKLIAAVAATVAAAGLALVATGSAGSVGATTAPPAGPDTSTGAGSGTITVTGSGTVTVEPDTAVLTVGVQANAPTGAEAMEQLTTDSNALTDALVAAGIDESDIQTSGLNLWSTTGDDGVTITGYQASLTVSVTIRDITAVGSTIDAAQQAVGEGFTIGGVMFSYSDPESVLEQARADAVANARTIAEQYATAAGVTLGDLVSIVDGATTVPVAVRPRRAGRGRHERGDLPWHPGAGGADHGHVLDCRLNPVPTGRRVGGTNVGR